MGKPIRNAFTLVESLVAISLTTLAVGAFVSSIETTQSSASSGVEQLIAEGLAQQLLDEALGLPVQKTAIPITANLSNAPRSTFTHLEQYHQVTENPILDIYGHPLGKEDGQGGLRGADYQAIERFQKWHRHITVEYMDRETPSLPSGIVTDLLRVRVRVRKMNHDGTHTSLADVSRYVTRETIE
ncbi:MAG: hypothetical protein MPJ24_11655 [Pirellulaceae bacterium]|nr:hypothetical protein [Pirellulaceae bacterium]